MTSKTLLRLSLGLLLAAGIALAVVFREHFHGQALENWISNAGIAGPVLFMLIYALATIFFLPGSVLTLAGGALFGPVYGTIYNLTGATLGAGLSFLVARYLAADWVEKKTGGRLRQLKHGVESEGWRFVAFVRLVPLFPFNLLNYALGLTRIRFWHYLLATYVFMFPGGLAYTYLGYAGREALEGHSGLIQKGLLALALLAAVAFIPRIIARLRIGPTISVVDLKERMEQSADLLLLDVRTVEDFDGEQHHVDGALNIPLENLAERITELDDDLDRPVALICRTDRRSAKAARILVQNGFADVRVVQGGMTDWLSRGYPVT